MCRSCSRLLKLLLRDRLLHLNNFLINFINTFLISKRNGTLIKIIPCNYHFDFSQHWTRYKQLAMICCFRSQRSQTSFWSVLHYITQLLSWFPIEDSSTSIVHLFLKTLEVHYFVSESLSCFPYLLQICSFLLDLLVCH